MSSANHHHPVDECEAISELIPDYAFGLTDVNETRQVESGLKRCPDAARALADFQRLQDEMRGAIRQVAPPPSLRDRILNAPPVPAPPTVAVMPRRVHPAWMAAAAAVVLLIVSNLYWFSQAGTTGGTPTDHDPTAFVLTGTSSLRWVRLPPEEVNAQAAAFLMWSADSKIGLMYAVGMPPLESGRIYELWLNREGERVSVGTFVVDESGEAALLFRSEDPIDEFAWAWITEEPDGGSAQPSEQIIARGEL